MHLVSFYNIYAIWSSESLFLKRAQNVYTVCVSALCSPERVPEITLWRKKGMKRFFKKKLSASEIKTVLSCLILCRRTFPCFQSLAQPTTLLFVPRGLTGDKVRRSRVWGKETKSRHLTVFRYICKTMKYISLWFWLVHF